MFWQKPSPIPTTRGTRYLMVVPFVPSILGRRGETASLSQESDSFPIGHPQIHLTAANAEITWLGREMN